jgi:hypothetical protein
MAMIFFLCMLFLGNNACRFQKQSVLNNWETSNSTFAIRVRESQEKRFPLAKFCYMFESHRHDSNDWNRVIETCTDDEIAIPRDWVRFVSDQTAYIFTVDKYAITMNGGNTWVVWEAAQAEINAEHPGSWFIKEVQVTYDGSGTLVLASRTNTHLTKELHTNDFGHSWR